MKSMQGFSLLEVIVVTAIVVIMGGALLLSFLTYRRAYLQNEETTHVQQQMRQAMNAIAAEMPRAGHVRRLLGEQPPGAANTAFQAPGTTGIAFQIAQAFTPPNTITWGDGSTTGRWVYYVVRNRQLIRCNTDGPLPANPLPSLASCVAQRVLANDIQSFSAAYEQVDPAPGVLAERTVTFNLEIRRTSSQLPGGSVTTAPAPGAALVQTIELRNITTE